MKSIKLFVVLLIASIALVACMPHSFQQELTKHDWVLITESEEQLPPLNVRFDHDKLISTIDTKAFNKKDKDYVGDELYNKFAKQLSNNTEQVSRYSIEDDEITLKTDQLDISGIFKMERDGKDIILTPIDSVDNTDVIIKLTPKK